MFLQSQNSRDFLVAEDNRKEGENRACLVHQERTHLSLCHLEFVLSGGRYQILLKIAPYARAYALDLANEVAHNVRHEEVIDKDRSVSRVYYPLQNQTFVEEGEEEIGKIPGPRISVNSPPLTVCKPNLHEVPKCREE